MNAILRLKEYIHDYEDSFNWGGPTMLPQPPSVDDLKFLLEMVDGHFQNERETAESCTRCRGYFRD